MNQPLVFAQLGRTSSQGNNQPSPKVVKLAKPQGDQAVTVFVDGATKIDFSDIANEKITLVHVGDRLVILFDGGATVAVGPFFDKAGQPLADISLQLAGDRTVTSSEFASIFPITDDQSVLPAAGPTSSSSLYTDPQSSILPLTDGNTVFSAEPTFFTISNFLSSLPFSNTTVPDQGAGDKNVPAGAGIPDLVDASDSGIRTDNITNVVSPVFRVVLDAKTAVGDTVELLVGGASLAHPVLHVVTASDVLTGSVFLNVTAGDLGADGVKSISAKFTDAADNTSTTGSLSIVLDTTTPIGSGPVLAVASDSGVSNSDHLTNAVAPVINVGLDSTVAVGDTIELKLDGASLAHVATHTVTAVDLAAGNVAMTVVAGDLGVDGVKSLSAVLTDVAGNSSSTGSLSITLDTTADVSRDLSLNLADTNINNAEKTSVAFTVSGVDGDVAGSDAIVTFTDAANHSVSVLASVGAVDLSTLQDGPISSIVSVADAAGNVATASGPAVTLDTTADASVAATLTVGAGQSGVIAVDGSQSSVSFVVAGLDSDATGVITFTDGVNPAVTFAVNANGNYAIDLSSLTGTISSSFAITDASGNVASVSGNALYTTIQSAIDAAADGDVIMIAAGTYNEALNINKGVTLMGANAGIDGNDASHRGAETIITWTSGDAVSVTTTHQVSFDGLHFDGTHVITASMADTNVAFSHSTFDVTAAGNASNNFYLNEPDTFSFTNNHVEVTGYTGAFFQPVGSPADSTHTIVTITDNTFNGHAGTYVPGDDNVVPVIANLSDVSGTVSGNTFHNVDIGILVGNGAGPLDITDNTFEDMHRVLGSTGGGYAAGVVFYQPAPFEGDIDISNNNFSDMDAGIRSSAVPGSTVDGSPIDVNNNVFSQVDHPGYQPIAGVLHFTGSTIDGTSQASIYLSGTGSDTIAGGGDGDHYLYSSPNSGGDHLSDFNAAAGDTIDFLIANFTGTSAGPQSSTTFGTSSDDTFGSSDERFHFNTSTHTLSYDADGSGAGQVATVLAVLDNGANVSAANIHGV